MPLKFHISQQCAETAARTGVLVTDHSQIETPVFMPVATNAVMRGVPLEVLDQLGTKILLSNTYHLLLRPGQQVFEELGGIHKFMQWPHAVLTDSGGFQIFSLARFQKITEEGVQFRSYVDGKHMLLSPELSIAMQRSIGSDIMMAFDQCIASTSSYEEAKAALERTTRWTKRCIKQRQGSEQALFGIVQGACFPDLREESAKRITDLELDGLAIGGLAVGESREQRQDITELTAELLPHSKARYLMGVGMPIDLLEAVKRGIDMFDCILPNALGQQGVCFTSHGRLDLKRGVYKFAQQAIDQNCSCATCSRYSRAYLHHLIKAGEYVAGQHISLHNIHFYFDLMRRIRAAIAAGDFANFYRKERDLLTLADSENPAHPPYIRERKFPQSLGAYEVVIKAGQPARIKHTPSGEVMHSVNDPIEEARSLYVDQSNLVKKVTSENNNVVLWDVGLGAATNAMCAIHACEASAEKMNSELQIFSFETDLDALRLALYYPGLFSHLRHAAPHALLKDGFWRSTKCNLSWTLITGDFLKNQHLVVAPDVIFYDPFSSKTDKQLWDFECFKSIAAHCQSKPCALYTYSASTSVRAALLAAGFFVAKGRGSGPKSETTIAYTLHDSNKPHDLLDRHFLDRWQRSDAQFPSDISDCNKSDFADVILQHPQFQML